MDTENELGKNKTRLKTNKLVFLLPFFAGGLVVLIILATYFYKVLTPKYEYNLETAVNDKQKIIDRLSSQIQPVNENNEKCSNNCVDQIYNWDNVKEFYSVKVTNKAWLPFSSNKVGIKFIYPIESNKLVLFEFNEWPKREFDPSGVEFSWSTRELGAEYGNEKFAWGASGDLKIGRMSVDIYKWTEQNGKYYIHSAGGNSYEVEKILVRDTSFGTQALFYKSPCSFFCDDPNMRLPDQNNLIVNLPYNHRADVESVLFKILDTLSDEDIGRLINSIQLINP